MCKKTYNFGSGAVYTVKCKKHRPFTIHVRKATARRTTASSCDRSAPVTQYSRLLCLYRIAYRVRSRVRNRARARARVRLRLRVRVRVSRRTVDGATPPVHVEGGHRGHAHRRCDLVDIVQADVGLRVRAGVRLRVRARVRA